MTETSSTSNVRTEFGGILNSSHQGNKAEQQTNYRLITGLENGFEKKLVLGF